MGGWGEGECLGGVEACLGLPLWSGYSYLIVHKRSQEVDCPPKSPCDSLLIWEGERKGDTVYPEGSVSDKPDLFHLGGGLRSPIWPQAVVLSQHTLPAPVPLQPSQSSSSPERRSPQVLSVAR